MEKILAISGKPGLFRMVNRGKNTLVVETIDSFHRRTPAFASDRITSLGDISIYTAEGEAPLWQVLKGIGEKENSAVCSIDLKKVSSMALRNYFNAILPDYDRKRVHDADIRKIIQWYNILVEGGITDFEAVFTEQK
ncbi:MAG: DUF5606 domain-containing protein [Prevotella sp.]|nr:DUF5606 domain-containing protein [Prevotella sp.]MCD8289172.1 DUF5606 domain-containing protein [Prevotella sp.]MCD8306484.1 DUF5606 domain-containing protein [Prevotella sp.]